jgi:diphthamide synthase subunit DPH2
MTDPTQAQGGHTGDAAVLPDAPVIPQGDALYDQLMSAIEPELTSTIIDTLSQKYKDETPEEAKVRAERYGKAFDAYDNALEAYITNMNTDIDTYAHHAVSALEGLSRTEEGKDIDTLEAQINQNTL